MYGLPKDADLSFLIGEWPTQICAGEAQIIIRFGDGKRISIQSLVHMYNSEDMRFEIDEYKTSAGPILELLGKKIISFEIVTPKELVLKFEDQYRLHIFDDSDQYESFELHDKDTEIYV